MDLAILNEIKTCLKDSEFWTSRTRANDKNISNLTCPVCGDNTAWAYAEKPLSINCNKMNSCGARTKTLELFEITRSVEKKFPATKKDKNRPAEAYLRARGLDKALTGLKFEYWPNVRECGSGAVMFEITGGKHEEKI